MRPSKALTPLRHKKKKKKKEERTPIETQKKHARTTRNRVIKGAKFLVGLKRAIGT